MAASASDPLIAPGATLDPALLAFLKCHVTSPLKWEALRLLAAHEGCWVPIGEIAHETKRCPADVERAIADLVREGVVEATLEREPGYRLPGSEPTSVVLHRLLDGATHSLELRSIIAAHLWRASHRGSRAAA